ncbi:MAG TPA: UDP-N-acetylmuramoyl-L-alanyl-D-glutamate--2,6-diaminopimelate ligase [Rubrivivax sp.]|nr:UDP-N-acetylmuramoyl-L-alanyl-D-glutamate--2,6-diaminopimelate ligase [Rubrivivax sp.]
MPWQPLLHLPHADAAASWLGARVHGRLRTDHRQLQAGDAFLAWPGYAHDARRFVPAALGAGASACLVDDHHLAGFHFTDARIAAVPHLKQLAGPIAHRLLGRPSERLKVVAATGTNGKTSTAWWLAQALTALGQRCALIGTLGIGAPGDALRGGGLTTPDAVQLQQALHDFAADGFAACAIEASSIGLHEHRLDGTHIEVALFTNLTQDHLDYHGDMAAYWNAKRALFAWPGLKAAVVNIDDAHGAALADALRLHKVPQLWTVSLQQPARLRASGLHHDDGGLAFELCEAGQRLALRSALIGGFNATNLLLVAGALRALGVPLADAVRAVQALGPVPGRMQRVRIDAAGLPEVVVDYAHTPDALDKALAALRPLARQRGGRLLCLFGCGGNRDAAKRPLMGAIAHRQADHVVLTDDNPRDEPPGYILAQILAGIAGDDAVDVIEDRREAIAYAVAQAAPADVLLLAGKGHERTQEAAGASREFCDADEARAALARRAAGAAA